MKKSINIFLILFTIMCIIGLAYSVFNIIMWKLDNNETQIEIIHLQDITKIEEKEDTESTEIIEQKEEIPSYNPYWDYIKINLIDVDFGELKQKNSDTVGWLQVMGTNINYPFVQTIDNNFYLSHSFDKTSNQAGWIFLDYRNNREDYDKNTIIYGHDLISGSMFSSLKNILNYDWQSNTNNHIIKISTEYENTLWQVFSIYTLPTTSDYLKITFNTDKDYNNFINMITERSIYNFNTPVSESDKILTLSSCYINSDNKIVLHAKMIKRDKKS